MQLAPLTQKTPTTIITRQIISLSIQSLFSALRAALAFPEPVYFVSRDLFEQVALCIELTKKVLSVLFRPFPNRPDRRWAQLLSVNAEPISGL